MDNNQANLLYIAIFALLIWNVVISFYLLQAVKRYKSLTRGSTGRSLEEIVQRLIERQDIGSKNVAQISQDLVAFQKKSAGFYQKSALLRFNPFEDSGGDQSFVAALLDGGDNGFIISSLHSRSGTRVYAKEIKSGKSVSHSLTKEEREALDKALRRK